MNNKEYIFICWTNRSDAGKDLVADTIAELIPCTKIKFSRAFKTWLEECLCIPYGALDDKTFRPQFVTNPVTEEHEKFTYDELMYNFFHKFKELYPSGNYLVPGGTKNKIINTPGHKSVVDVRNQTELKLLEKLSDKYNMILFYIAGDRGETKSTDNDITLDDFKFVQDWFTINNWKWTTKEDLKFQIGDCLKYLELL